jgi:hypothetical protein
MNVQVLLCQIIWSRSRIISVITLILIIYSFFVFCLLEFAMHIDLKNSIYYGVLIQHLAG